GATILGAVLVWRVATVNAAYLDLIYPTAALVLVLIAGSLTPLAAGVGDRARLKRSLDANLAPVAMAAITRSPELLNLTGQARTMSYIVCNIRRYPQIAESFADEPEGLRRMTRRSLSAISATVLRYHGTIDRITPGGLTAFFNAPLEDPEHAVHA